LGDPEVSHDYRAVVQLVHRLGDEQGHQKLARDRGVDRVTLVHSHELVEVRVLLERDDGADAVPREIGRGIHDLVYYLGLLRASEAREPRAATDALQTAADVVLEHDHDQQDAARNQRAEDGQHRDQLEQLGNDVEHENHAQPDADLHGAGASQHQQSPVNHVINDQDVEQVASHSERAAVIEVLADSFDHPPASGLGSPVAARATASA